VAHLRAFEAQNAALIAAAALIRSRNWDEIRLSHSLRSILAALDRAAPATAGVALISPDGELALASRVPVPPPAIDLSDREYVAVHQGSGPTNLATETFVGEVSPGAVTGRPVFRLSRPHMGEDGHPDGGVVSTAFFPAYFSDFWQSVSESPKDVVLLVRHDGAVLARQPEYRNPVGARLLPGPMMKLIRQDSTAEHGALRMEPEPGLGERLIMVRQLPDFPVSVIYAIGPAVQRMDGLAAQTACTRSRGSARCGAPAAADGACADGGHARTHRSRLAQRA
jgi:hypothetical protein